MAEWQIPLNRTIRTRGRTLNDQRRNGSEALARGDYGQALTWFHLAAAGGDADAMHDLALMYRDGLGIEVDADEAMRLFTRAAYLGHAESRYALAIAHRDGHAGVADRERALHWMKEAADATHPDAMRELALAYALGDGVAIDFQAAIEWAARAAIAIRDIDLLVSLIDVIDRARAGNDDSSPDDNPDSEPTPPI